MGAGRGRNVGVPAARVAVCAARVRVVAGFKRYSREKGIMSGHWHGSRSRPKGPIPGRTCLRGVRVAVRERMGADEWAAGDS